METPDGGSSREMPLFSRDNAPTLASLPSVNKLLPSELGEPFYEGSVQRLHAVPGDDSIMVTRTTSRGSVFDVGALFEIAGNDVNRALFRHVLYSRLGEAAVWRRVRGAIEAAPELDPAYRAELLGPLLDRCCERGARTHHEGMLDALTGEVVRSGVPANPSACNVVRKFQILKPERTRFLGAPLFDYAKFPHADGFVVPLEYIVRFGITSASSVFKKYAAMESRAKAAFERELGATRPLEAWHYLERPISDFTSKFEPEDRMVSKQEALVMSGLSGAQFAESGTLAVLGAWVVRDLVEEIGLRLWDLKWEFAKDGGELVFVDTIDTDSIRATMALETAAGRFAIHYNKQAMRDYFVLLHRDWIADIAEAKLLGQREGVAFTEILKAGQAEGRYAATPAVDPAFLALQEAKMAAIRDHLVAADGAEAVRARLEAAGRGELAFYEGRSALGELRKINGI